jgi:hypothetical protein
MKKIGLFLTIILVVGSLGIYGSVGRAQSFPSYVSGITMQNLSSNVVTVNVTYYDETGTSVYSTSDTISGYGVKDYATIPATSPLQGSAVITSNYPVGAVSTLRGDNKGRGAYVGFSQGNPVTVLPLLMKNWGSSNWNTWFSVQNTGNDLANITVDYAACAGSSNATATGVKPGSMVTFNQKTEPCLTNAKVFTSAVVSSNQPIAIVVAQESTVVNSALVSSGFAGGSTNPVVPLMNSNNPNTSGWRTAISIFNQGSTNTNVTITYVKVSDGSTCTETQTVPAKQSKVFAGNNLITTPPAGVSTNCTIGATLVGSAYVSGNSASQSLVATVNQDRGSLSSAYGALAPAAGTPKVVLPQIQDRNGSASQWASSLMIMNVGAGPTYVKCTFANTGYAPVSGVLNSYKAWEDLQRGKIAVGYVGSGECTAYTNGTYTTIDTNAKIVGVVNVRGTGTGLYDLMMTYEGMNVTP